VQPGQLYHDVRLRVTDLVTSLDASQLEAPVPACPKWKVRDVVAHLVGVADCGVHGRMEGAPGEAWTDGHVEARRDTSVPEMLAEWDELGPQLEALPLPFQAVADVASHEQDIRGAVDRPGWREDNDAIDFVVAILLDHLAKYVGTHELAPLEVRTEVDVVVAGANHPGSLVTLTTTRFELFRAVLGRRSRAQVQAMAWDGDPTPYLDHFFVFGPAELDVIE
jgi:uncharacterized protein (TIGR03083 family)